MPSISIRPITYEDTDNIIKWRNSDYVRFHFIYQELFTRESHEKWMQTMVETGKVAQFIISLDNIPVGSVYLRDIDNDKKTAEYGIFIGEEEARGKGVGTESARLILKYAFEEAGLEHIFLRVFADNPGAIKSYEKAGFVSNGQTEDIQIGDHLQKVVFMSLEKENFEG